MPERLLTVGALIRLLPVADDLAPDVLADRAFIEHVTELTVVVALMGVDAPASHYPSLAGGAVVVTSTR